MKRGANEWGERRFVVEIRSHGHEVRGVVRNLATGERRAFASRTSFERQMIALLDASAPRGPPPTPSPVPSSVHAAARPGPERAGPERRFRSSVVRLLAPLPRRRLPVFPLTTSASTATVRSRDPLLRAVAAIAFVLSVATWGVAGSTLFRIDDSGVDYTDHETEEVYVALAFADGELTLSFHDQPSAATLPAIAFEIPDLEREDFWGDEVGAVIEDISEIEWSAGAFDVPRSPALNGARYMHTHTHIPPVVEAYVAAFAALGFDAEITDTTSAGFKFGTFTHGDHRVRVDFRRHMGEGNRVAVDLQVL